MKAHHLSVRTRDRERVSELTTLPGETLDARSQVMANGEVVCALAGKGLKRVGLPNVCGTQCRGVGVAAPEGAEPGVRAWRAADAGRPGGLA